MNLLRDTLIAAEKPIKSTIIFVQMKRTASQVCRMLRSLHIRAVEIHGDRSQTQREQALSDFRTGNAQIMVATDVAARGLDIPNVSWVVNYDMPASEEEFDSYIHRIGRTGRAGNTGVALSFFVPGFEPKRGNGALVVPLIKLLQETDQIIPEWLKTGPRGGNGKGDDNGRGKMIADVRLDQSVFTFHEKTAQTARTAQTAAVNPHTLQPPYDTANRLEETISLPPGWQILVDPSSDRIYYANPYKQVCRVRVTLPFT